jgi:ATP-dependent helicase/nuclease subunit B
VLNFKRLCNRIFREYGGLSYNYIKKSGKALLMWQALTELSSHLQEYTNFNSKPDSSLVSKLLGVVGEFKAYRITPASLERALEHLSVSETENSDTDSNHTRTKKLQGKLNDLSLIYADYIKLVSERCDDAGDDLTKAASLLKEHDFFAGADVYLDSFNGFTPQEFEIIRQIMRQADNLTISLCIDKSDNVSYTSLEPFINIADTANRLIRIAKSYSLPISEEILTENKRTLIPELRFVESNLWSLDLTKKESFQNNIDAIKMVECPNLFAECEAAAVDIMRRVRQGASWRDFTITMRGADRYDGIIDVILEKYGIPFFFSKRTDITSKPLIRLILAAFTIKSGNFRTTDVISYIKTGLCGLNSDEVCALETYAETWSVRGAVRWNSVWNMNPQGYTADSFTEASEKLISEINSAREKIVRPLTDFHTSLDNCKNVIDYSKALYDFLLALEIPSKLEMLADRLQNEGETADSSELRQLWGILIDSLDELCATIPDLVCDCDTYVKLLNLVFAETDIGRIPGTIDEVVIGDASLLRAARKHTYVLGANEGIFPKTPDEDGVFSDFDRELLGTIGIELSGGSEYRSADERFTFYRALTSASDSLTVIWSNSDLAGKSLRPSFGVLRLMSLFPSLKPVNFNDLPISERLEGRRNLPEFVAEARGTKIGQALADYCTNDPQLSKVIAMQATPITDIDIHLCEDTSRLVAGGDLALTQSRLDSYVLCHFSYFCKYILKLKQTKPAEFDAGDIGTFIHRVLERFVARAAESGNLGEISDEQIETIIDEIVGAYMTDVCKIAPEYKGSRLGHLFAKLKRTSRLLCKNLADEFVQSEFTPAFYELPISFTDPDTQSVAPLEVKLEDNTNAYIYGVVDRVDVMKRDGKVYVRVVDYKTGSKEFSLDDIKIGLNLQMLLYLFSLWKNGSRNSSALKKIADNADIIPAGALYFSANVPTVTLDAEATAAEVEMIISEKLSRRGLLLNDDAVLSAMERELTGRFLPVKRKKDGGYTNSETLKSLNDFSELLNDIEKTIRSIGSEIKRGNASARPLRNKRHNACEFCDMKPICRRFDR